jgi:acyl carrier protein
MTNDDIKALVLRELGNIAPEIDPGQIDSSVDLREQVDLDSMNILDLMIAIHQATGVEIPETDYPRLLCLNDFAAYLGPRIKDK